jgi:hypothetical protein
MLFSKNRFYPVPCMVCKSEDDKGRWTCSWCSLRVCKGCRGSLREISKEENHVVGSIDRKKREPKEVGDHNWPKMDVGSNDAIPGGQQELMGGGKGNLKTDWELHGNKKI